MEQKTLKYLRVLIPGFIILIGLLPLQEQTENGITIVKSLNFNYMILLAVIIGAIYYQLNIQHIITRLSHYLIVTNIKEQLINIHG